MNDRKTKFMPSDGDKRTKLMDSGGQGSKTRLEVPVGATEGEGNMSHDAPPVVGWLAVISGPGTGRSRELTFGMNPVGRNSDNRVALDFGDQQVSGKDHFRIAYDGRNRKFMILPAAGDNLVYIGDDPVLESRVIESGVDISVGDTVLRFIALCGPQWSWSDEDDAKE